MTAECVIIGRSNIVGKPMGMLLLRENGTVTICHSHTPDLKTVAKRADILVVAIGKAKFVDASYVKDGAAVIDVGMDRDEMASCVVMLTLLLLNRLQGRSHRFREALVR